MRKIKYKKNISLDEETTGAGTLTKRDLFDIANFLIKFICIILKTLYLTLLFAALILMLASSSLNLSGFLFAILSSITLFVVFFFKKKILKKISIHWVLITILFSLLTLSPKWIIRILPITAVHILAIRFFKYISSLRVKYKEPIEVISFKIDILLVIILLIFTLVGR